MCCRLQAWDGLRSKKKIVLNIIHQFWILAEHVSGAGRKSVERDGAVSGGHRRRWSVSGARSGELRSGNGAESGLN